MDTRSMVVAAARHGHQKMRHKGAFAGLTWKVDECAGDNKGLVIAEVELAHEHARGAAGSPWR